MRGLRTIPVLLDIAQDINDVCPNAIWMQYVNPMCSNMIAIKTKYPEFLDWKWEELSKITDTVVEFKLHVYQEIQKEVEKVIN